MPDSRPARIDRDQPCLHLRSRMAYMVRIMAIRLAATPPLARSADSRQRLEIAPQQDGRRGPGLALRLAGDERPGGGEQAVAL